MSSGTEEDMLREILDDVKANGFKSLWTMIPQEPTLFSLLSLKCISLTVEITQQRLFIVT